nr:hypothetical protein CFP56_14074 [Quercus suber]
MRKLVEKMDNGRVIVDGACYSYLVLQVTKTKRCSLCHFDHKKGTAKILEQPRLNSLSLSSSAVDHSSKLRLKF